MNNKVNSNDNIKECLIVVDKWSSVRCFIRNNVAYIEVIGNFTTSNHHNNGFMWTEINCGELKGHLLDDKLPIQLVGSREFYISETEKGYGFYTKSNLVIIYYDFKNDIVAHEIHPRFDDSL